MISTLESLLNLILTTLELVAAENRKFSKKKSNEFRYKTHELRHPNEHYSNLARPRNADLHNNREQPPGKC